MFCRVWGVLIGFRVSCSVQGLVRFVGLHFDSGLPV